MGFLSAENLENHAKGLETLQRHLSSLLSQHTCASQAPQQSDQSSQGERASGDGGLSFDPKSVDLPVHNMAFSGTELKVRFGFDLFREESKRGAVNGALCALLLQLIGCCCDAAAAGCGLEGVCAGPVAGVVLKACARQSCIQRNKVP